MQAIALEKFNDGDNIFITGPGGSGKSYIIKQIKENAEKAVSIFRSAL